MANYFSLAHINSIFRASKSTIISLTSIFLLGLLSITWFGDGYLLTGTDLVFPPDRWGIFQQTFYIWDARSLRAANARMLAWSVTHGIFLGLSDAIGLSLASSEKVWFYFLFTLTGLSMHYLTVTIVKGKYRHLAGVTSALFYMLNPYMALGITNWPYFLLTYASLPLKLGLYINGVVKKKGIKYVLFMCLVWWATSSSQCINLKYAIFDCAPLLFYLALQILASSAHRCNKVESYLRVQPCRGQSRV